MRAVTTARSRLVRHIVDECPHCGKRHEYAVQIRPAPVLFGGGSDELRIGVVCPDTGRPFETSFAQPRGEEFLQVVTMGPGTDLPAPADASAAPQAPTPTGKPADTDAEYTDWLESSRGIGIDYGKSMMTVSSGAVAVYFAVLKYLGADTFSEAPVGVLSALPPILFLAATAVFAAALRPRLAAVSRAGFPTFRDERLRQLNRLLVAATSLFLLALTLALVVFIGVMQLV